MPEDDELRTLVATHISEINVSSSPGFDTITPTFIKRACKRMPKQNERSCENLYGQVPHIAALFKLLSSSHHPQVLERSKAHSHTQEGASDTARELQNDCDQWYAV